MSEPASGPSVAKVHGALFAVQVAFASLAVAGRIIVRELDPLALALVRLAGAALVLGLLDRARPARGEPMGARDRLAIAGCAALGIFGNQALFLTGLQYTSATHATLLVATIPVFTALAGIVLHRAFPRLAVGEPARADVLGGISLAFLGVVALVLPDALAADSSSQAWLGDLLVTANSAIYAVYLVLIGRYASRHGSLPVVAWGFLCGAVMCAPLGAPALLADAPALDAATWALVAYVVLFATVFTYLVNAWALRFAPSWLVASYIFVQPLVAACLAWLFLGEVPTPRLALAGLLVAGGVGLVVRAQRRALSVTPPTR